MADRPSTAPGTGRGATLITLVLLGLAASLVLVTSALGRSQPARTSSVVAQEKLFVAYADGTCGNSWRTTVRAEIEHEVSKHPEIGKFVYKCAQGKLNQGIANVQSLTSQGVDILIVFSDWGKSLLPALRAAHNKGVIVVPWNAPVGGEAGKDYTAFVGFNISDQAKLFAQYIIRKLKGRGNVVGVGGPAGNDYDNAHIDVMKREFKKAPGIKFLEHAWADWAPGPSAKAMATLLSKYDTIDAVWTPEATTVKPELDQFITAGRPAPIFASLDVNGMMGDYLRLKPKNPTLEWGFVSALTWGVRNALLVGLQAKAGKSIDENLLTLKNYISDCATACKKLYRKDLPADYIPTTKVPPALMKKYLK
jgi:ribose transport system substrate-binding protein